MDTSEYYMSLTDGKPVGRVSNLFRVIGSTMGVGAKALDRRTEFKAGARASKVLNDQPFWMNTRSIRSWLRSTAAHCVVFTATMMSLGCGEQSAASELDRTRIQRPVERAQLDQERVSEIAGKLVEPQLPKGPPSVHLRLDGSAAGLRTGTDADRREAIRLFLAEIGEDSSLNQWTMLIAVQTTYTPSPGESAEERRGIEEINDQLTIRQVLEYLWVHSR